MTIVGSVMEGSLAGAVPHIKVGTHVGNQGLCGEEVDTYTVVTTLCTEYRKVYQYLVKIIKIKELPKPVARLCVSANGSLPLSDLRSSPT